MAGRKSEAAKTMLEALEKGLTETKLLQPEIPAFQRLQKEAQAIAPNKQRGC